MSLSEHIELNLPNISREGVSILAALRYDQQDQKSAHPYPNIEALDHRPMSGYRAVFPYLEAELTLRDGLKRLGLDGWEAMLRCEIYLEDENMANTVYAPLSFNAPLQFTLLELRLAVKDPATRPELKKWIERILSQLDPDLDPTLTFQWSRIKIVDLIEGNLDVRLPRIMDDLDPSAAQASIIARGQVALVAQRAQKATVTRVENPAMASENLYEEMFNEIKNPATRDAVRRNMEAAIQASRSVTLARTEENITAYVHDGIWHEFAHAVAPFMSEALFARMIKVMGNTGLMPANALWFKNRGKALLDVRAFRMNLGMPVDEKTETWQHWKFFNEQFADYFAIYLMKKLGQEHYYTRMLGITVPAELEQIFDEFFADLVERNQRKQCYILRLEDKKSAMLFVQDNISAGLSTVMPLQVTIQDD